MPIALFQKRMRGKRINLPEIGLTPELQANKNNTNKIGSSATRPLDTIGVLFLKKYKTYAVFLSSYRNTSVSLREREMLWEHEL